jgi:hypothetical protein
MDGRRRKDYTLNAFPKTSAQLHETVKEWRQTWTLDGPMSLCHEQCSATQEEAHLSHLLVPSTYTPRLLVT